jgi:hypothetical protein
MHWSDIENTQPRLAGLGHERLIRPGVVLVATIRRDGTARLSPVEPFVLDGDLWLSMMWQSAKARDLLRDPRILVHSVITNRDGAEGEFKVRGTARAEDDPAVQRRYADTVAAALGWNPQPGRFQPVRCRHQPGHVHQLRHTHRRPARRHVAAGPRVHPPSHDPDQCGRGRAGKRPDQSRLTASDRSDGSWLT